jgi:hypothetical protein
MTMTGKALLSTAMAVLLLGCGQSDEPPAAVRQQAFPATGVDLEGERPAQTLRRDAAIPAHYPDDAPRFPGATNAWAGRGDDLKINLMFGTEEPIEDVDLYMQNYMIEQGWENGNSLPVPDGVLLSGTKDGREIGIMLRRIAEGTSEQITMIAVSVDP